jgi:hypothetical protein
MPLEVGEFFSHNFFLFSFFFNGKVSVSLAGSNILSK